MPGEPEPDWVARERAQFREHRDLDKNGKMDRHEVGEWIMPSGYDPVEAEAQHLFYHADRDRVGLVQMYNYYFWLPQWTSYGNHLPWEITTLYVCFGPTGHFMFKQLLSSFTIPA